ncbi:hypothetical protein SAMN05216317_12111 [Nitrosomonas eutropha]|nr:hypothetical protein SAMN05216317_12111 [Nitrosomonas eutropha]
MIVKYAEALYLFWLLREIYLPSADLYTIASFIHGFRQFSCQSVIFFDTAHS